MARSFPQLPTLKAQWAPVYLEPIMYSGERITVGIAATAANHDSIVIPALSEKQLTCIFGREGASLFNIVQITLKDLSEHLKESPSLTDWRAPFSGMALGEERTTLGDNLVSVVQNAMRLTACFSSGLMALDHLIQKDTIAAQAFDDDRWPKQIFEAVQRRQPNLADYFDSSVELVQGARPTKFDFFGKRYVANFGKLIPHSKRLGQYQDNAKAKLWNLASLRDAPGTNNILGYELILWRPAFNDPTYTEKEIHNLREAILELSEEAKREGLSTLPVHTAEEASSQIVLREAA